MQNHEVFEELLPGYALGILDDEDAQTAAAHLKTCDRCRKTIVEFQTIAADLTLLIREIEPRPALKDRLMARVDDQPQRMTIGRPAMNWLAELWQAAWLRPALAALVLILIAGNVVLFVQLRQSRELAVGDFRPILLAGSEYASEASGLIIMSDDGEHGTLIVQHLPALPESKAYQLWLIDGDLREDGGVFEVSRAGYAAKWVYADKPLADYQAFGVTIEPKDGSESPTGENVLASQR